MDRIACWQAHIEALTQQTEPLKHQTQVLEAHTQAREAQTPMVERRCRWAVSAVLLPVATLLGALGIALGSVTPAHADVIQCGDVLGPGGRFELEHDLECPGTREAVTVRDGAILDLQGHIVACPGGIGCIILTGTGAQLLNGAVGVVFHESIVLEGNGGHTVRNVTSTGSVDHNIAVLSDQNQLINVYAASGFEPAVTIVGNHNRLIDSIAECFDLFTGIFTQPGAALGCIRIDGNENRLINNFATSTSRSFGPFAAGFGITGNNNVLRGNRALRNDGPGIVVTGTGNRLTRNTALNNSIDLVDTSEDCDANRWIQNTFRTSLAGTMEDPACIQNQTPQAHDVVELP
jgi:parallel beta-helix repeat protein